MSRKTLLLCSVMLFAGCSLAPKYHSPEITIPEAYRENPGKWAVADINVTSNNPKWWEIYKDAELNGLQEKVTSSNQNLKAALARYDQALADAAFARGDFFPQFNANASADRNRTSQTVSGARATNQFNNGSVGGNFSYELDLWGRVRNEVSASSDLAKASKADMDAVAISLHSELALNYFALRGEEAKQKIIDETVSAYQKALELTRAKYKGGAAPAADVDQAETQLENAKTLSAETKLKRIQLTHAIAVLVGEVPANFSLKTEKYTMYAPVINPGVPSKLLGKRPDIAAAILKVQAANAQIGVARAAYLPDFTLSGAAGYQTASASKLFNAPSMFWSLGPSATFNIFAGGKIKALSNKAQAAYDESVANYRQAVLVAFKEVEDNLIAIRQLGIGTKTQKAAMDAAERSLEQSRHRYNGGIANYIDIVVTQNAALQAELNYVDLKTRYLTASVLLVKALGGGWEK